MVILGTPDVLRRIWCAGEITSGVRSGVNMILVECRGKLDLSDDFINHELQTVWTDDQLQNLVVDGMYRR